MFRSALAFVALLALLLGLSACRTLPAPGWHNPNKTDGEYDYDFYNCRMIALQTIPQPVPQAAAPVANAVYSQCYMMGNVQQCWQQHAPIYPDQTPPAAAPPVPDPAWLGQVESATNECLARQGWRFTPAAAAKAE